MEESSRTLYVGLDVHPSPSPTGRRAAEPRPCRWVWSEHDSATSTSSSGSSRRRPRGSCSFTRPARAGTGGIRTSLSEERRLPRGHLGADSARVRRLDQAMSTSKVRRVHFGDFGLW